MRLSYLSRISFSSIKIFAVLLFKFISTRSLVLSIDKPPRLAASGEAFKIEGEPEVPDCLPSPTQGKEEMPFLKVLPAVAY